MKKMVLTIVMSVGIVSVLYSQNNQVEQRSSAYVIKDGIQIDDSQLAVDYLNSSVEKVNNIMNRSLAPVEKSKAKLLIISNKISRRTYIRIDDIYKSCVW